MGLDILTIVNVVAIVGSIVVNCFLAYLYNFRVKIEQKQTQIMEENAESKKCLKTFRASVKAEKKFLSKMSPQELEEFLNELEHLGEEE